MQALENLGDRDSTLEHIDELLQDADKDKDGKIDYEEFCSMMRPDGKDALQPTGLKMHILKPQMF